MTLFEGLLKSLEHVVCSEQNRYLRELRAADGKFEQKVLMVGEYIRNNTVWNAVPSGIPVLDQYLPFFSELQDEAVNYTNRFSPLTLEKFVSLANAAIDVQRGAKIPPQDAGELGDAVVQMEKPEEALLIRLCRAEQEAFSQFLYFLCTRLQRPGKKTQELREELYEQIEDLQLYVRNFRRCVGEPDQATVKERIDALINAYHAALPKNPSKQFAFDRRVAYAAVHRGREYDWGGAPCPVASLRNEARKNLGILPDSYEAVEFVWDIVKRLVNVKREDLAEAICQEHGEKIPLLKFGRKGFKAYDQFTGANCPGCSFGPTDCDFMGSKNEEVAKGDYARMKCPLRHNGTVGMVDGRRVSVDYSAHQGLDHIN